MNEKLVASEKESKRLEEAKILSQELAVRHNEIAIQQTLNSFKPQILFQLFDDTEFLFWHYIFIQVHNCGGDANTINFFIEYRNSYTEETLRYSQSFSSIRKGATMQFKTGRTKDLVNYDEILVKVTAFDTNGISYNADCWNQRADGKWLRTDIQEQRTIAI